VIPVSLLKQADANAAAGGPEARIPGVRVFSPKTAQSIREMLALVCGPGGTAPKAQAMGYTVGGKSGTAYKQEGKGYAVKKYRSWFVGMAPITHPRIIVAVMVDEPSNGKYFGGDVAAPVFSEVVQQTLRTLGVPPDLEVKTQIITKDIPAEEESF
jgi:cell division protein FtsI (penicillin-binding protein 3)